ncbi:hypothetical protein [Amycolatopsis suaedae]|uniref:Uncharacterized protein n=1 Tax=Amycolatopsis suaedae TaxID=2510978 RepID=A0A4Q7J2R4_9PSEU|nr:hypothetical protein [Amycolatopsis suaedae]RZQ60856.1 hypothetical protein EWH70_27545 [Amycolatopsis suaedae]
MGLFKTALDASVDWAAKDRSRVVKQMTKKDDDTVIVKSFSYARKGQCPFCKRKLKAGRTCTKPWCVRAAARRM